jgi:hypothetical protein
VEDVGDENGPGAVDLSIAFYKPFHTTEQLADLGLFTKGPGTMTQAELSRVLDPVSRTVQEISKPGKAPSRKHGKGRRAPTRTQERLDYLQELALEVGLHRSPLTDQDIEDLERIDLLTHAESQIERLKDIEVENVETGKWNHDCSVELIALALAKNSMPFGSREELYDLRPTADDPPPSSAATGKAGDRKGKGKEKKRAIYHLLPTDSKESWLGKPGERNLLFHQRFRK